MAVERQLAPVGPILFTSDGGKNGIVNIPSTKKFKVKAQVSISANSLESVLLEVKRVVSETQLIVGEKGNIRTRADISAYTVALGASITQAEQERSKISPDDINRGTFEEEPTLARRVAPVDWLGRFYDMDNPFPVQLSDGNITIGTVNANVDVQLTDKESSLGANDYDITRIGDGQNQLKINNDGSINTTVNLSGNTMLGVPTIRNISMSNPNTEYSFVIPRTASRYEFRVRGGGSKIKYNYIPNFTDFIQVSYGTSVSEIGLTLSSPLNIYVKGDKSNLILELIYWE